MLTHSNWSAILASRLNSACIAVQPVKRIQPSRCGAPLGEGGRKTGEPAHLLLIGPARSGTTILLNALNTSPEMNLLSECNSYREHGEKNFRERFNAVQAGSRLQTSKASYAPRLPNLPDDADNDGYFAALSAFRPIFGEKIALTTPRYGHDVGKLQSWIERRRPWCLFVFRHPEPTLKSMAAMFPSIRPQENIYTYAMAVCLYLDLARYLPNVAHVVHEEITPDTFRALGGWLNADLGAAHEWYEELHAPSDLPAADSELAALFAAYDFLARVTRQGGRLAPSLAQNGGFLGEGNKSELAKIYFDLTQVMQANLSYTLP